MFLLRARRVVGPSLFAAFVLGLSIFYVVRNRDWGFDDSFITYRYADNLRLGYGLAFNPGERHYGSTAMGFAIVLAGCSWLLGHAGARLSDIHLLAQILSAASIAVLVWLAYRILEIVVRPAWTAYAAAAGAAWYLFTAPASNVAMGHETYPFLALLAGGAYLICFRHRYLAGSLCLGIAPMLRPDCALFLVLVLVALALRQLVWGDIGWSSIAGSVSVSALMVGTWAAFTTFYFGSPIPETMIAKKVQVLLGYWPVFSVRIAVDYLRELAPKTTAILFVIGLAEISYLTIVAIRTPARVESRDRDILTWGLPWAIFGGGVLLAYRALRVTYWGWYVLPIYFALMMIAVAAAPRLVVRGSMAARILLVAGLLILVIDAPGLFRTSASWLEDRPTHPHLTSYDPIVEFLRTREPGGTTVATAEPGTLAYRLGPRFRVIDELGLASPEVARHLMIADVNYPFIRWNPEYVIVSYTGLYSPEGRWWFSRAYGQIGEFQNPFWQAEIGRGVRLFQRRADPAEIILTPPETPAYPNQGTEPWRRPEAIPTIGSS